jgi:hypothetical protein
MYRIGDLPNFFCIFQIGDLPFFLYLSAISGTVFLLFFTGKVPVNCDYQFSLLLNFFLEFNIGSSEQPLRLCFSRKIL